MRRIVIAKRVGGVKNPKISAYSYLKQWADDPNVYISFTEVDKIGINPKSSYPTPLGVYTFPLKVVWSEYDIENSGSLKELPYVGTRPNIWVLRLKPGHKFVHDLWSQYTDADLKSDKKLLKELFYVHYNASTEKQIAKSTRGDEQAKRFRDLMADSLKASWKEFVEDATIQSRIETSAPFIFWNLTHNLARKLSKRASTASVSIKWNWILRKCGYSGFADKSGKGVIYRTEPVQAVFLTSDAYKVIGKIANKDYEG